MLMRTLGRTGLQVSTLSLGAMNFGGGTDPETSEKMLLGALDAGINLVDTADVYHAGESERIVGDVLARSGRRDEVIIATKCGMPIGPHVNDYGGSRRHIVFSAERSLRNLGTDRIDLYQLHRPYFDTAPEETLSAFDHLVSSGKVLNIGSSMHPAWFVTECLAVSDRHGWPRYVSDQSAYNLLDRRVENEFALMAQRHNIAMLPWSPLAGGILAGRYPSATDIPPDSRAGKFWGLRARVTEHAVGIAQEVARLGAEHSLSGGQLALLWLRDQPGVTSPIIGPRTPEQLAESLVIADHEPVGPETRAAIDELVPPGGTATDFFNTSRWTPGSEATSHPLPGRR